MKYLKGLTLKLSDIIEVGSFKFCLSYTKTSKYYCTMTNRGSYISFYDLMLILNIDISTSTATNSMFNIFKQAIKERTGAQRVMFMNNGSGRPGCSSLKQLVAMLDKVIELIVLHSQTKDD